MIVFALALLGLILGSFLNALVWRLRHKRDWVRERSECTHCHHQLSALDLIPVFSWVYLRGKCRYCHKKIEDSPLTEFGLALSFGLSYLFWPYSLVGADGVGLFGLWLIILCLFAVLSIYDFKWFLLPDRFTYAVLPVSAGFVYLRSLHAPQSSLIGAAIGAVTCFGIFYLLFQLSAGKWIGGGDVKLAFSLGLLAGSFGASLALIFLSSMLGTIFAIPLIIKYKKVHDIKVPYGPFLMLATILVVLFYGQLYSLFSAPLFVPY